MLFSIKYIICFEVILSKIFISVGNMDIGLQPEVSVGIITFAIEQVLAIFHWVGNVWVFRELFTMYTSGDVMYSATGFISDTGILLYPVEQSFIKLLDVFNTWAFISWR